MRRASCRRSLIAVLLVVATASIAATPSTAAASGRPARGDKADPHYEAAQAAFDEGNLSTAVTELKQSIEAGATARAYLLLGNSYLQLGQIDEANKAFEASLKLEKRPAKRAAVQKLLSMLAGMAKARLRIESTPPGATVYVDLKAAGSRGQTPLTLSVVPGRHRIIYSLEGYDDALATPDPYALEGQEVVVDTSLRKKGCDVTLSAKQKGVLASIDGDEQVPLPTTLRVTPGKHEAVLAGRGLTPKAVAIACTDFKPLRVEESLDASGGGLVHVHASAGYNIYVDGRAVSVEDAANLTLPPGPHEIEVEAPGNPPWHAQVTVRAGEQTDVKPQFTSKGMGITGLEVVPIPEEATLWLDGKPLPPRVMTAIKAGSHLIEARARNHLAFSRRLDLQPGEITRIEARLKRASLVPLSLGIAFTVLAAGAEGTAIYSYLRAGREVQDSDGYKQWKNIELAGHITAGACAAVAIAGFTVDLLQRRAGLERPAGSEPPAPTATLVPVPLPDGGSLVVSGTFR